jgi:4,5-DOPA dioxygenase extradiol
MTARMPALFLGHGNPMNALADNEWTRGWSALGRELPRPQAILSVSAHWYLPGVAVTAMAHPRTIHDFGGFPKELYECNYRAPGEPALATRVQRLLEPIAVARDESDWGLDHGTWSVLCHVYPAADIPVVQLRIDEPQPAAFHYEVGRRLRPLRDEGVLVVGSGNVVHNLHAYGWGRRAVAPYDWASKFEDEVRRSISTDHHQPLIDYEAVGPHARLSAPTPEHYLPLLYVLGAGHPGEPVSFPVEGMDGGSVSMLAVRLGA